MLYEHAFIYMVTALYKIAANMIDIHNLLNIWAYESKYITIIHN